MRNKLPLIEVSRKNKIKFLRLERTFRKRSFGTRKRDKWPLIKCQQLYKKILTGIFFFFEITMRLSDLPMSDIFQLIAEKLFVRKHH